MVLLGALDGGGVRLVQTFIVLAMEATFCRQRRGGRINRAVPYAAGNRFTRCHYNRFTSSVFGDRLEPAAGKTCRFYRRCNSARPRLNYQPTPNDLPELI